MWDKSAPACIKYASVGGCNIVSVSNILAVRVLSCPVTQRLHSCVV